MELTIEKLIYGGDGLARLPADDAGRRKAAFIPLVLPGETVEALVTEEKTGFVRANVERMVNPSPERVAPFCPYFGECGGCHYQHAGYESQLRLKESILRETIERIAKIELPQIGTQASPPRHYRNRTRMHVQHTPEFAVGYYRTGSHALLPVKSCPISAEVLNRALSAIWEIGAEIPTEVSEIEFFCSHDQQQLMVELWLSRRPLDIESTFHLFAGHLQKALPELISVTVLRQPVRSTSANETVAAPELDSSVTPASPLGVFGQEALTYRGGKFDYRVSAGSFFQTNLFLSDKLMDLVTAGWKGTLALDLYAGVGLFSLPMAESFEQVIAVESSLASFADLQHNSAPNIRTISSTTEQFLSRKPTQIPDLIVVDPPRAGLGPKVSASLARLGAPEITYLACDPSTQARDLGPFLKAGYRISEAHLIDLFPQTYHIESLLRLKR